MAAPHTGKVLCKAHIKDICYSRMYITGHFDAPFENYRLDSAVYDLVSGTGVPRSALLPLTCFLHKGYLFTVNNRRLWALRHAFMFLGRDEETDVIVLPDNAMPERKDYVARLAFHKQEALVAPAYNPIIHGDQPKLQKLVMRPIVYRFDLVMRNGYKMLPGGRLLCINATEAALAFQATGVKLPLHLQPGLASSRRPTSTAGDDDDDTMSVSSETPSMASLDFPGRAHDAGSVRSSWSMPQPKLLALPPLTEGKEEGEGEEEEGEGKEKAAGEGGELSEGKKKDLAEVATKFKAAVANLRLVLDNLDEAFDKLAA